MSKKSKRYGKWRKEKNRVFTGGFVGCKKMEPVEALVMGLIMHFADVINPEDDGSSMDSLSCELCIDYRAEVCPGRSLKGGDVVDCIANHVGLERVFYSAIAEPAYIQ